MKKLNLKSVKKRDFLDSLRFYRFYMMPQIMEIEKSWDNLCTWAISASYRMPSIGFLSIGKRYTAVKVVCLHIDMITGISDDYKSCNELIRKGKLTSGDHQKLLSLLYSFETKSRLIPPLLFLMKESNKPFWKAFTTVRYYLGQMPAAERVKFIAGITGRIWFDCYSTGTSPSIFLRG